MDNSPHATESVVAVRSKLRSRSSGSIPSDDQCFLLYFILGTYFGPDLKGESPQKSSLQRLAEGLPSYTPDQLAGSHIKTVELERVYYHVLRKADKSVVVKGTWLDQFFHGNLPMPKAQSSCTAAYPQFPDLFPPQLHPHSRLKNRIIENVVFINHPETYYIKPEDIARFKRLTGLRKFVLDRDGARLHTCVDAKASNNLAVQGVEFDDFLPSEEYSQNVDVVKPIIGVPYNGLPVTYGYVAPPLPAEADSSRIEDEFDTGMVFLPCPRTSEEWGNIATAAGSGSAITGTAALGNVGPSIGLLDIGESEDSYLFRVSLPGVKRDEREFGCEVENDGKVLIRGVTTTGETKVYMHSQVFEMQTQNLCPSGHFSISFMLPGPVDPQQFSGNFGTDGILEGIVMKGMIQKDNH